MASASPDDHLVLLGQDAVVEEVLDEQRVDHDEGRVDDDEEEEAARSGRGGAGRTRRPASPCRGRASGRRPSGPCAADPSMAHGTHVAHGVPSLRSASQIAEPPDLRLALGEPLCLQVAASRVLQQGLRLPDGAPRCSRGRPRPGLRWSRPGPRGPRRRWRCPAPGPRRLDVARGGADLQRPRSSQQGRRAVLFPRGRAPARGPAPSCRTARRRRRPAGRTPGPAGSRHRWRSRGPRPPRRSADRRAT